MGLNRLRAMENNLFALGFEEYGDTLDTPDAQIHAALVQAKALKEHAKDFALLSLYEQRIARTLQQARKDLKAAQAERAAEQAEQASRKGAALREAAMIHNLHKARKKAWQPADSGFEFSSEELQAWMRRRQLEKEAETFFYTGDLPGQEEEEEENGEE